MNPNTDSNTNTTPAPVKLTELCPDRCNITDRAFASAVDRFMKWALPGFPMGLLDTSDPDRWEILAEARFEVEEFEMVTLTCPDCGHVAYARAGTVLPCPNCDGPVSDSEATGPRAMEPGDDIEINYAVRDSEYGSLVTSAEAHGEDYTAEREGDDDVAAVWILEEDAEAFANERNQDTEGESRCGFPWAHLWAHLPDSSITDELLQGAGFVVATYTGGAGGQYGEEFRLCGIDGGGYSFTGQHFAPLYFAWCMARGVTVETDNGERTPVVD